jgi:cytoskeletal protein RodZ
MTGRQRVARLLGALVVAGAVALTSACVDEGAQSPPTISLTDVSTETATTSTVTTEVTEVDVTTTLGGGTTDTGTTSSTTTVAGGTVTVTSTQPAVTVGGKGSTVTVTLTAIPAGEGPTGGPGRGGALAVAGAGALLIVLATLGAIGRARRH